MKKLFAIALLAFAVAGCGRYSISHALPYNYRKMSAVDDAAKIETVMNAEIAAVKAKGLVLTRAEALKVVGKLEYLVVVEASDPAELMKRD